MARASWLKETFLLYFNYGKNDERLSTPLRAVVLDPVSRSAESCCVRLGGFPGRWEPAKFCWIHQPMSENWSNWSAGVSIKSGWCPAGTRSMRNPSWVFSALTCPNQLRSVLTSTTPMGCLSSYRNSGLLNLKHAQTKASRGPATVTPIIRQRHRKWPQNKKRKGFSMSTQNTSCDKEENEYEESLPDSA